MRIFDISSWKSEVWASSWRPLDRRWRCSTCSRLIHEYNNKQVTYSIHGCGSLPDIVRDPGNGLLFIKDRVVDNVINKGLLGLVAHEATLVHSEKARDIDHGYLVLDADGSIDVALEAVEGEVLFCRECGALKKGSRVGHIDYKFDWDSWDGSDFIRMKNVRNRIVMCTKRVVEIAHDLSWSNFRFGETYPHVEIDYLDSSWEEKLESKLNGRT